MLVVHVMGTNGKGLVVFMVAVLLMVAGLCVGVYFSFYVDIVWECLIIDG